MRAVGHQGTRRHRGQRTRPATCTGARAFRGDRRGGGRHPSPARLYPQGRLAETPNSGSSQPRSHPQNPPRAPPETALAEPSRQAPRPLCRQPHRRRGRTADPSLRGVGGALPLGPVSTLPVPLGNPRSSILGHPTARTIPETPRKSPETVSEPVAERCGTQGQVSMPASRPSRYRAQSSMSRRRRSNRSVRRYAASMGLRTLCASAASATSRG